MNNLEGRRAIALGSFDGLHRGHIAVMKKTVTDGCIPTVLLIKKLSPAKRLLTDSLADTMMAEIGISEIIEQPLDDIRDMSPEQFVRDFLKERLNAGLAVCGFNYRFGKNGAGDANELKRLCEKYSIDCEICDPVTLDGEIISSTAIRRFIENGEIEKANEMLGYHYTINFTVSSGRQLGRTLGTPTINQILPNDFVSPRRGVYASYVTLDGKKYASVTNFGIKPTIEGENIPMYETWILGFEGDLYGKDVETSLLHFVRDERKFSGLQELKEQIVSDGMTSMRIFDESIAE